MASSEERRGNQRVGAAYRAGYAGRGRPRSAEGDSFAESAYSQGVEDRETGRPADARLSVLGRHKSSGGGPAPSSAADGGKQPPAGSAPGAAARSARPRGAGKSKGGSVGMFRYGQGGRLKVGGDAGGFTLAIFLYPIVLSMIQYGAAGPGMWMRAKFLNKTTPRPGGVEPPSNKQGTAL